MLACGAAKEDNFLVMVGMLMQVPVQAAGATVWLAASAALLLFLVWLGLGRGPRRRRLLRRARRQLEAGQWQAALAAIGPETDPACASAWQERFRKLQAYCYAHAGEVALSQKDYESSLAHRIRAAQLLGQDPETIRTELAEVMLVELRGHVAGGSDVQVLSNRLAKLFPSCAEAIFWQALDEFRRGQLASAMDGLRAAADLADGVLDPPLYLGTLLLRQGETAEALPFLEKAHQLAPLCPLVAWQFGAALTAARSDTERAVSLLQFALGPTGLPRWLSQPAELWTEGYAEASHAYVPRLAAVHTYHCPVFGSDVGSMLYQARLALGQAHDRLKQFAEAADVYAGLLRDYPPTVALLRGLGLALARLGRYDAAFTHLRTAQAREPTHDPLVASYLALCAARGKPLRPEDRTENLRWALSLLRQFDIRGNEEWADVYAAVVSEARNAGSVLSVADVQRLGEALVSVSAITPDAAFAYADLAASTPDALRAEHARLYGRAAAKHRLVHAAEYHLFARLFGDEAGAAADYAARGWDLEDVKAYALERHAATQPGSFPDWLDQGEDFLFRRSIQFEQAGQPEAARQTALLLVGLAPRSARALDRVAYLEYRRGELAKCVARLAGWEALEPANPTPALRHAVVARQLGQTEESAASIARALTLTSGPARAQAALLGCRLALSTSTASAGFELSLKENDLTQATALLRECLASDPANRQALGCLAAICSLRGDQQQLAELAPAMQRLDVPEPGFHYLASVCHLAADAPPAALAAADQAAADPAWAGESAYLKAHARLALHDESAAERELNEVLAQASNQPVAEYARALLGRIYFAGGRYQQAARCWAELAPARRTAWQLEQPLAQVLYLAGVAALRDGAYEDAISWLRAAAGHGVPCRELLNQASLRAAGQAVPQRAAELLEELVADGITESPVLYRLALARKRLGRWAEARQALEAMAANNPDIHLQLGLLAFQENDLNRAEAEFALAWAGGQGLFAGGYNLLMTRLSLGRLEEAEELTQSVAQRAPEPQQKVLAQLHGLLHLCSPANGTVHVDPVLADMTAADEKQLLALVRSVGHLPTVDRLLRAWVTARPDSELIRDTAFETLLVRARELVRRCCWADARRLLAPRGADPVRPPLLAAGLNLLGVCECMMQDFEDGRQSFTAALRLLPADARLCQNLALTCEWQQRCGEAIMHWQRCVEVLDERLSPPDQPDYAAHLTCAVLTRLANLQIDRQQLPAAIACLERAHRIWPQAPEVLDRLFELYRRSQRHKDASRALDELRQSDPDDPRQEVYALELLDLRTPGDVEQVMAGVDRLGQKHAGDPRVETSLAGVLSHAVAALAEMDNDLAGQLARARTRLRNLPPYEIDWDEVEHFARRLHRRLLKLKCVVDRGVLLARGDDQQHLRQLSQQLTRQAAQCRRLVH